MNAEIRFKDTRLLEALEYIDDRYIEDVFNVLKEPDMAQSGYIKHPAFKHWKQYLAAAACLLLLALAIPIIRYVPELINSFAAGWGNPTESTTEAQNTHFTEPLNPDPYSINQAELDQINAAWAIYINVNNAIYCSNPEEIHYLSGGRICFYGKYNGCIVLHHTLTQDIYTEYEINGNLFRDSGKIWGCRYGEPSSLVGAYKNGWLSDEDIEEIYKNHNDIHWSN